MSATVHKGGLGLKQRMKAFNKQKQLKLNDQHNGKNFKL